MASGTATANATTAANDDSRLRALVGSSAATMQPANGSSNNRASDIGRESRRPAPAGRPRVHAAGAAWVECPQLLRYGCARKFLRSHAGVADDVEGDPRPRDESRVVIPPTEVHAMTEPGCPPGARR